MSFNNYYQGELTYLREMGRAFAQAHPAVAGMLSERGTDPDVERLLEGFAFLTGRVQQRIDAALPALVDGLTEMLLPHFARVTPACTTIEFKPDLSSLRGRQTIPAGTELHSRAVQGTRCGFRTCAPLELLPAAISSTALNDSSATRPELRVGLALQSGTASCVLSDAPLLFHIHGDWPLASHLLLWMLRHCTQVTVVAGEHSVPLGPGAVRWAPLCTQTSLWPWPELSPRAMCLALEYFTLPSKFLYFEVCGLEAVRSLDVAQVELRFTFDSPPPFPGRLPQDMLRLHCVPAANLFKVSAASMHLSGTEGAQLVRANDLPPDHSEVFSIDRVVGHRSNGRTVNYGSFYAFEHALKGQGHYYVATREASPVDEAVHHFIRLSGPRDEPFQADEETLSIDLTCTNRSLPHQLQVGDIRQGSTGSPTHIELSNIERVTRPARPPLGSELQWQFLAHLSAAPRDLAQPDALRAVLSLYNWQRYADVVSARANARRIEALRSVRSTPTTRIVEGAAIRGLSHEIELDQTGFVGAGDIFLFGALLDELMAGQAPVNSFSELSIVVYPAGDVLTWTPRLK